jgi:hypothetical protein
MGMGNIVAIGPHVFCVYESGGCWRVVMDGTLLEGRWLSRSEATWAASGLARTGAVAPAKAAA